ncbi:expressed unknown protein [Seminavis robusta]|uniref:Class I SAM-dependent methyltransferase n=1 Tax=Seminavis robusta TaxID=568900 RepID=A0A9N8HWA7_9STRA|nr:expressed unknown protein [Seminavis robusta]|eukprot:Sro2129_g315800.1 n/a (399) ;mRNA; r:12927-14123
MVKFSGTFVLCLVAVSFFAGSLSSSSSWGEIKSKLVEDISLTNQRRSLSLNAPHTDSSPGTTESSSGWPGQTPSSELGHPLVRIGHSFLDDNLKLLLLREWDDFISVYNSRHDRNNICGMRVNHAYAVWLTVRHLKPSTIIESGINAGLSTYLLRHAAPNSTRIYSIDPRDQPICNQPQRWIDPSPLTTYYTGANFVDLQKIDWQQKIDSGEIQDPANTLIFQDDHTNSFEHVLTYMKYGFRHVLMEDNYRPGEGGSRVDKSGFSPKQMLARVDPDSKFFFSQLDSYAEFPPLFPPVLAKDAQIPYKHLYNAFLTPTQSVHDVHEPLFRPDLENRTEDQRFWLQANEQMGYDPQVKDKYSFFQWFQYVHIAYFRVRSSSFVGPFLAQRMEIVVADTVS